MPKVPFAIPNIFKMSSASSRNIAKMSAAGSGKTYDICKDALEKAQSGNRVLITAYTNRGAESARKEIRLQNDGVLHPLVVVKTWFSFMMSDMIKPYQRYLTNEIGGIRSFDYSHTYGFINFAKTGAKRRYITSGKNVISNEGASLVCLLNQLSGGKVIKRLEEKYHAIYFDEIQDMAGDDIEIIRLLIASSIEIVCCGDNKQATFSTHNAKKNKQQTGKNIWMFFEMLEKRGLVNIEKNLASRRFNHQICCFANIVFPVGEPITTIMNEETKHDGVYLIGKADVDTYMSAYTPQVLRFDKKTDTYGYFAINFGACKGETFERILIVPNGPLTKFVTKGVPLESPEKYYVAVTRPKYSIAIVLEKISAVPNGYVKVSVDCDGKQIQALKYLSTN